MIDVYIARRGNEHRLEVKNHADSRVCSGVSALTLALCGWCKNHRTELMDLKIHIESGNTSCSFVGSGASSSVFEAVEIGLLQIEKGYPGEIKVHDFT